MPEAVSNTSPLLYLHRVGLLELLPELFGQLWVPGAVDRELKQGQQRGFDVPVLPGRAWLQIVDPSSIPSEWLLLDLGPGEFDAKDRGLIQRVEPILDRLEAAGMWMSVDIRQRILALAREL